MPRKYRLSNKADKDIEDLLENTYQFFGMDALLDYMTGLEDAFQLLADDTGLGEECDHIKPGLRCYAYGQHIIYFRRRLFDTLIVRIIHVQHVVP